MTRRSELLHCISCTVGWLSQVDAYFSLTLLYSGLEKEAMYLKIINYSVLTSDCIFIQLSGKHRGRRQKILTCSACRYMYGVNIARDSRNMLPVINFYPKILYSGKLSSKIPFTNFEVLWLLSLQNYRGMAFFDRTSEQSAKAFSCENFLVYSTLLAYATL